jgi:hypothetical protein
MGFQYQTRLGCDGIFIISWVSPVSRTNFDQFSAALFHNLRKAERAADFNQFSPGNNDFLMICQAVQGKEDCCGIIIYYRGSFSA